MKCIIVLAVCMAVAYAAPLASEPDKDDYRNEFDHLLMMRIHDELRRGEAALLRLQMEINDLEKTKNKEEKDRIIREMETMMAFVEGSRGVLQRELERTDLNIFERYNFEVALKTVDILERDLKKEEERIKNIEV